jgi:hypothetical protein
MLEGRSSGLPLAGIPLGRATACRPNNRAMPIYNPRNACSNEDFSPLVRNDADWPIARLLLHHNRFDRTTPYSRPGVKTGQCKGFYGQKPSVPKGVSPPWGSEDVKPPISKRRKTAVGSNGIKPPKIY